MPTVQPLATMRAIGAVLRPLGPAPASSPGAIPVIRQMAAILSRVGETPAAREQRERQESMQAERKTLTDVVNVAQPEPLERPRRRL